jgi:hypothetical protein
MIYVVRAARCSSPSPFRQRGGAAAQQQTCGARAHWSTSPFAWLERPSCFEQTTASSSVSALSVHEALTSAPLPVLVLAFHHATLVRGVAARLQVAVTSCFSCRCSGLPFDGQRCLTMHVPAVNCTCRTASVNALLDAVANTSTFIWRSPLIPLCVNVSGAQRLAVQKNVSSIARACVGHGALVRWSRAVCNCVCVIVQVRVRRQWGCRVDILQPVGGSTI